MEYSKRYLRELFSFERQGDQWLGANIKTGTLFLSPDAVEGVNKGDVLLWKLNNHSPIETVGEVLAGARIQARDDYIYDYYQVLTWLAGIDEGQEPPLFKSKWERRAAESFNAGGNDPESDAERDWQESERQRINPKANLG